MLADIKFTDIYISSEQSYLSGVEGGVNPLPVPQDYTSEVNAIRLLCEDRSVGGDTDYTIVHDGVIYRVSLLDSISAKTYVLRRMPSKIIPIKGLGIHQKVLDIVLAQPLSGLIVIAGAFGSGKTTTASAIIAERLTRHGGIAVTVEDPPEMPLDGRHGDGVCYQTHVKRSFSDSLKSVARQAPNIIFLGEVREADSARQALISATNGAVVICTIHADDLVSAIERLYTFASESGLPADDASRLLASGLSCVIHQEVTATSNRKVTFLSFTGQPGAKSMVAHRKFNQLSSEVNLQLNKLLSGF